MNHSFDTDHACAYGLEEAVLISNFQFWISKNKANEKHLYDGRTWTYSSTKAFAELFPYMSVNVVRRAVESLVSQCVLIKGNYNQSAYDRTTWFAFFDESMFLDDQIHLAKKANGKGKKADSHTDDLTDDLADESIRDRLRLNACPPAKVVDLYHEILPELPSVRLMTVARKKAISGFWKFVLTSKRSDGTPRATDAETALAWIRAYFERARANDFLMGRGAKAPGHEGWTCSIDFLMSEKGRIQVIEKTKDAA